MDVTPDAEQCEAIYGLSELITIRCLRDEGHEGKHKAFDYSQFTAVEWE